MPTSPSSPTRVLLSVTCLAVGLLASRAAKAAPPDSVHVHLDGEALRLERKTYDTWQVACASPCDRSVPAGVYRLTREEHPSSTLATERGSPSTLDMKAPVRIDTVGSPFQLDPRRTEDVSIRPNGQRTTFITLGVLGMVTGGSAGLGGAVAAFFDSLHCLYGDSSDTGCARERQNLLTRDAIVASAGVVVFVTGVVMLAVGAAQPRIGFTDRGTGRDVEAPAATEASTQRAQAFSWRFGHGESARETARLPGAGPAMTFPILSGRF